MSEQPKYSLAELLAELAAAPEPSPEQKAEDKEWTNGPPAGRELI